MTEEELRKAGEKAYKDYMAKYPDSHLPNNRIDFSKISGPLPIPYLVQIQTESFKWFLEKGLDEVMREIFPIADYQDKYEIEYVSSKFAEPENDPLKCKDFDITYCSKLYLKVRMHNKETGERKEDGEIFMGDVPLMTESGTFIVNGAERVIVSQIIRSPGAYYKLDRDIKTGFVSCEGEIYPYRGTWIQLENDKNGVFYIRIDHQRKMPAVIFLKALGIDKESEIYKLFGDYQFDKKSGKLIQAGSEMIGATLEKDSSNKNAQSALIEIFRKMKPGEPVTENGVIKFIVDRFFDERKYDLGRAGRFKYNKKLGIYNRLEGCVLAENLIDANNNILFEKDHKLTKADVQMLRDNEVFENGAHEYVVSANPEIDTHTKVNILKVYADNPRDRVINIIGTDLNLTIKRITISDILAGFSYYCNILYGIGETDDIDHLGNRRVRCVGELLQNQFRVGLSKMAKAVQQKMSISADLESVKIGSLINTRPLTSSIREFFASGQLSQFMDQTNPLAELTNKRRISALGPGGLTRERASMAVRDVHYTHYGRICPIESPEGQNIGLINNLATYGKIDDRGFIETPYRYVHQKVDENGVTHVYVSENEVEYLTADEERNLVIAEANIHLGPKQIVEIDGKEVEVKEILDEEVVTRKDDDNGLRRKEEVNYVDVSPKQIVSIAASCIPFLENDDATRALMGANMQRQALPLLKPHLPFVGTGLEGPIAKDSGLAVVAKSNGTVTKVDSSTITVKEEGKKSLYTYQLQKFARTNQGTCMNQVPVVHVGDQIKEGQVIADGPSMRNGELALGQNVLIAYMTWHGYNYEDAIIMSEKMVKDDTYTSIHIQNYDIECRETKLGDELITRDVPNLSEDAKRNLDEDGVIIQGAEVKEGDVLVGKVTPKGQTEPSPEDKLLQAIFAEKTKEGKDTSLRVPHGGSGIVHSVKRIKRDKKNGATLAPGVMEVIRVYIIQKRKISEGDKMSGRHGNKGVISKILPVEDMPFLPDGTPIDIMLSPMGVPSRMNIGQIFEVHLGLACKKLGLRVATPVFDGVSNDEIADLMKRAGISEDGKSILYDGQTGERFSERISVGVMYMIKLVHMVDDKLHARATGPYSLITQQPLGGKAQKGGQRFGEMEVWALEAYGAAHVLQEMLTIKSDDRVGRRKAYEAIIRGNELPGPSMPEAFKVMTRELKGLGMSVALYDKAGEQINMETLAKDALVEERRVNASIRKMTSPRDEQPTEPVESIDEPAEEELIEESLSITTGTQSGEEE